MTIPATREGCFPLASVTDLPADIDVFVLYRCWVPVGEGGCADRNRLQLFLGVVSGMGGVSRRRHAAAPGSARPRSRSSSRNGSHAARPTKRTRTLWCVVAEICCWLLVVGCLSLAQFVWSYWAMGLDSTSVSHQLEKATSRKIKTTETDRIAQLTMDGIPPVEPGVKQGELYGYLHLPRFGKTFKLPIQEGTSDRVLANMGVGHYEGTALPGEKGNASFAGHATYNDLANLGTLDVGDQVIVEGADYWWVYTINRKPYVVPQEQVEVVGPTAAGAEYGMTLTTCYPVMPVGQHATHRMIAHATLMGWADKKDGVPEQLAQTHESTATKVGRSIQTVSDKVNLPVTGVVGLGLLAIWLLLNLISWLVSHERMRRVEWARGTWFNPIGWMWRLTAGIWPSNQIVFKTSRLLLILILSAGLVFCAWRWACPWIATTFLPDQPHPGL